MADTNLTNLIVNSLTREEYHNADLTDHQDELFVQSDHAGVHIGSVGVDGLDTTNISNCITNIPQDIKLELSSGTLTLKAGSKVYMPNGAGVFDVITTTEDKTVTASSNGSTLIVLTSGGNLTARLLSKCVSGSSRSLTDTYMLWYDTTNNVINNYGSNSSTPQSTACLPIALVTVSSGAISSIDQVFNGFGYIGSTVFVLPGVKGLIPNGRNADGTLKNKEFVLSDIIVNSTPGTGNRVLILNPSGYDGFFGRVSDAVYVSNTKPTLISSAQQQYWFNPAENIIYKTLNAGTSWTPNDTIFAGTYILNTTFDSFNIKPVFRAVDYSDTEYISHCAMPSGKYINLTLPASGNSIVAPADGYVVLVRNTATTYSSISLQNSTSGIRTSTWWNAAGTYIAAYVPVSKGDSVLCQYTSSDSTIRFRFIYANGAA